MPNNFYFPIFNLIIWTNLTDSQTLAPLQDGARKKLNQNLGTKMRFLRPQDNLRALQHAQQEAQDVARYRFESET